MENFEPTYAVWVDDINPDTGEIEARYNAGTRTKDKELAFKCRDSLNGVMFAGNRYHYYVVETTHTRVEAPKIIELSDKADEWLNDPEQIAERMSPA